MNWFRNTLAKNRVCVLAILTVSTFTMVGGPDFAYAHQVHQQKEGRLREIADTLGIPLERLQRVLREHEEQLAANPYLPQIEAVKNEHAIYRIERDRSVWLDRVASGLSSIGEVVGPGVQSRYGYASRELDSTGYICNRARYMDPAAGRFISPDPLRIGEVPADGTNSYSYVGNNPVMFSDPSGLNRAAANVNDITVSLTLIAAFLSIPTSGLAALVAIFGFGVVWSNVFIITADNVQVDELIAFTGWVGRSIGLLPVPFVLSVLLPVSIDNTPDPFDNLNPEWFTGASVYFSMAVMLGIGVAFTLVAWDVFGEHRPIARLGSPGDVLSFGIDAGFALGFPPFAWSWGG